MAVIGSVEWSEGGKSKEIELWDDNQPDLSVTIRSSLHDKLPNCTHPPDRIMLARGLEIIEIKMSRG